MFFYTKQYNLSDWSFSCSSEYKVLSPYVLELVVDNIDYVQDFFRFLFNYDSVFKFFIILGYM
jgi:hypothetical protein